MLGPQSLMPLMKALGVDKGSQLTYPSMWGSSKQQNSSKVSVHSENNDRESSMLCVGRKDSTPNSRPSDKLEKDQFHSTLSSYYNNTRDTLASPGTLLSSVGVTGLSLSGVLGSSEVSHVPSLRHTSQKRQQSPPQSPCLPTVAPGALTSRSRLQSESALAGLWADLAENEYLNTQEFWLALYFFLNLSLTLYNKVVLVQFPYPYTVTALHALCGTIGGWSLLAQGLFVRKRLSTSDKMALVMFSVLYAMNIAISNVSLNLVTIPFHQVVRAATPIFTMMLSSMMFGTNFTTRKVLSLIPVILGVALATYGDYYFTVWGLILTLLGTFLAALKTIFTNVLQSNPSPTTTLSNSKPKSVFAMLHLIPPRLAMHPLDLLTRMSPLAFIQCVFYAWINGELKNVRDWSAHEMTWFGATGLITNGCIAFGLNIVSFTANKKAGALSMTVAGMFHTAMTPLPPGFFGQLMKGLCVANIKQVLTILFAVFMFNLHITSTNAAGILFTLVGGAWYGYVGYGEKKRRTFST
ncbi:hypothetical protein BDM02DRAFT_508835 [Thelephora ganbajun]|uniref:Uncharacterized protein n=1 Tax=Thelephora ganbajun TaxID=370292 RepID=A0ACB6Z814_THEGA|nr:hypothetical protein BDM02DRAFT_508835 [Thelephora ganbajun]